MNEFYVEQLVPKTGATKASLVKSITMVTTVLFFAAAFFLAVLFFVPAVVSLVVLILSMRQDNVEFEYMYLNGELDIDKIIAKQKRKHKETINMTEVIVVAPMNSPEVRPFQSVKVVDYSSGTKSDKVFMMVYSRDNQNAAVLIEPNETLLKGMKLIAPRKVFN